MPLLGQIAPQQASQLGRRRRRRICGCRAIEPVILMDQHFSVLLKEAMVSHGQAIFISGVAGYIGSHAAYAPETGVHPIVIDNLSTGHTFRQQIRRLRARRYRQWRLRQACTKNIVPRRHAFRAFIEVGEFDAEPANYDNNRRATIFRGAAPSAASENGLLQRRRRLWRGLPERSR